MSEETTQTTPKPKRKWGKTIFNILVYAFAIAGFGIIGAWAFYQLGFTKNKGAVDKNYRYLMSVDEMDAIKDSTLTVEQVQSRMIDQYARLAAFGKYHPTNAMLIMDALQKCNDPMIADRMIAAASVYLSDDDPYRDLAEELDRVLAKHHQQQAGNVIPWMNSIEWEALKEAIVKDTAMINQAARLTGVEPRLIAGCLIGEQIRLFNSKREMFKKYLGPVKVLSVQSQFSYGVNGIREHTALAVESHLKDPKSEYYMGKNYEHLLDFETDDPTQERYTRLVDYRNHLYSYIYTGCIVHQTMLQWKRAGYDISNRPDILFTLFNVGFPQSKPKADPLCGGSHITVAGQVYTFGAIGFDFYYSGELINEFPYWDKRFISSEERDNLTAKQIADIQNHRSSCSRPEYHHEYKKDSTQVDNPDGTNNATVTGNGPTATTSDGFVTEIPQASSSSMDE